jgi:hypothetical protein
VSEQNFEAEPDQAPAFDQALVVDQVPALDEDRALGEAPGFDEVSGFEPESMFDEPAFDFPDPPETGDVAVDEAINAVAAAISGPLEEQLSVYDAAHRTLQDRLADVEG